ncbi:MAG TPA: hypothetical protein VIN59_05665 [Alphaproteobacteria bacterium]
MILALAFLMTTTAHAAEPAKVTAEPLAAPGKEAPAANADTSKAEVGPAGIKPQDLCYAQDMMLTVQGADYVPGVDAYGKPVAPADVKSTQAIDVPERIDVPVDVDIVQALGLSVQPPVDLKANVGTISILKDGRVLYNNMDISSKMNTYCADKPQLTTNVKPAQ